MMLPRRNRAVVLIVVLWIVILLSLMAYSLLFLVGTETMISSTRKKLFKAEALARAGLAKAIVDLRNDMIFDNAKDAKIFDAEGDVWARPEEEKDEVELGRREDGTFSVRVYDEEGLINLNRISAGNMLLMQKILEQVGYEEEDAKDVAAAIADYRDPDTQPARQNAPSQAEGYAYAMLSQDADGEAGLEEEDVTPVIFRNEDFVSVEELLEVWGVTPEVYFGPGNPEAVEYRARMGPATTDRFAIKEKRRSRRDDEPIIGLKDFFTVHGSGILNLNTAPQHVLAAYAEAAGNTDGDAWAERVIRTRRGGKDEDIDNGSAFKDTTELNANGEIASVAAAGSSLLPYGLSSSTFTVVSEGRVGDVRFRLKALVARQMGVFLRDEDFEAVERSQERRERNSRRFERRQDRENTLQVRYPIVRILQTTQD